MIIDGLAVIGAGTCLFGLYRALSVVRQRARSRQRDVVLPAAPPAALADDIAVIAAAVHVMLDSYRIVRIESAAAGVTWSAEGRWMHQTSHRPR